MLIQYFSDFGETTRSCRINRCTFFPPLPHHTPVPLHDTDPGFAQLDLPLQPSLPHHIRHMDLLGRRFCEFGRRQHNIMQPDQAALPFPFFLRLLLPFAIRRDDSPRILVIINIIITTTTIIIITPLFPPPSPFFLLLLLPLPTTTHPSPSPNLILLPLPVPLLLNLPHPLSPSPIPLPPLPLHPLHLPLRLRLPFPQPLDPLPFSFTHEPHDRKRVVHAGGEIRHAFAREDFGECGVAAAVTAWMDIIGYCGRAGLVLVVGVSFSFFIGCGWGGAVVEAAGRFVACGGVVHEAGEGSWGVVVFGVNFAFLGGFLLLAGFGYGERVGDGGWWELVR